MNEITLTLTQEAYLARERWDGRGEYEASATDEKGNSYQVTWLTIDDLASSLGDEESDLCDWGTPYSIQLMEKAE